MVMSGEIKVLVNVGKDKEDGGEYDYEGGEGNEYGVGSQMGMEDGDERQHPMVKAASVAMLKVNNTTTSLFAHNIPTGHGGHLPHILPRSATHHAHQQQQQPMIAPARSSVSFENPAMASLYDLYPSAGHAGHYVEEQAGVHRVQPAAVIDDASAAVAVHAEAATSHGLSPVTATPNNGGFHGVNDPAFFAMMQRQQQQLAMG